jgi:hypothetical protein
MDIQLNAGAGGIGGGESFLDIIKQQNNNLTNAVKHYYYHSYGANLSAIVALALYRTHTNDFIVVVSMNAGYSLLFLNHDATEHTRAMLSTADSAVSALMQADQVARLIGATLIEEVAE